MSTTPSAIAFLLTICPQPNGVAKIHPLGQLSKEEEELLAACLPELKKNIEKGKKFVQQS